MSRPPGATAVPSVGDGRDPWLVGGGLTDDRLYGPDGLNALAPRVTREAGRAQG